MIELSPGIDLSRKDATSDLDGTAKKFNTLEEFIICASSEGVFDPLPDDLIAAKQAWKEDDTEQKYTTHTGMIVRFFIEQVPGKSVDQLQELAEIVASQQKQRRWNIVTAIIRHLQLTHNTIAISHMPEWLMEPFVRDLGFVALIGSTYVTQDGVFTGEAYSINKAVEYTKIRDGDTSKLDIHIGDTIGDSPLFDIARRPIIFNGSYTLFTAHETDRMTILNSHKDVVTIINPNPDDISQRVASIYGPPFDIPAILSEVQEQDYRAT